MFLDTPGKTASVFENDMYNHLVFPVNLQQWFVHRRYEGPQKDWSAYFVSVKSYYRENDTSEKTGERVMGK